MASISLIFFLSGLSALVYQLLWMRHLGFIFGNTVYAGATVLTAFMFGLALGAHVFGKYAERIKNPLRCFAWLEWGIAAYALMLPFLFSGLRLVYRLAYRHVSDDLIFLTLLRFSLAFGLLLLPTVLMGGTLPVLIRGLAHQKEHFGRRMSWLYGINTLGAVGGVLASGFWLIPFLGLTNTNFIAVLTDVIAGAGAWLLARYAVFAPPPQEPQRPPFRFRQMPARTRFAVIIATLCGFVSLALEVIWFRALILVFGSTTYSFTLMLAVFLLGISLGSLLIAPVLDRLRSWTLFLALAVGLVGLFSLASLYYFDRGPEFLLRHLVAHDFSWQSMTRARFLISLSHLAVPTLLFGMAFTTATRIVREDEPSSSGAIGIVYALDALGATAGAFAGGFILLPRLGMERSLLLLGLLMVVAGFSSLIIIARQHLLRWSSAVVMVAVFLILGFAPPSWNHSMLASGAFFSPFNFVRDGRITLRETILNDRLLHYEEALSSTVSVHLGINEQKFFCIDGKTEADQTPRSMVLQRMIGHLPMLFHPNPRKAVNIGLGAGVSFGALGRHPLDHLEVVEIEPAVKQAVRVWGALNHHILEHPDAIITLNDGRNHLFSTTNTYDVITADPFEPVMAGAAHLYTADYFQLARGRLKSGGIMAQYLPLYELSLEDYLSIVRSFVSVFPQSALFYTGFDTILLGFESDMHLDANVLRRQFEIPEVKQSLADIGFSSPEMILGMFVADLTQSPDFAASGIMNTDDRPFVEFSAPRSALRYTTDANQSALLHVFTPIPPAWLEGLDEETARRLQSEHEAVRLMLEAAVMRAQDDKHGAYERLLQAHATAPENPVVKNELVAMMEGSARTLRQAGQRDEAARQFQIILRLDPHHFWAMHNLVELGMLGGHIDFAEGMLQRARETYPDSPVMQSLHGKFLFSQGSEQEGLAMMEAALSEHPDNLLIIHDLESLAALSGAIDIHKRVQSQRKRLERYLNR